MLIGAKEDTIFPPQQKTDVGFTVADGADPSTSSILVTDYEICGTKEGLKKDSKAKTVPIGEVAVPQPEELKKKVRGNGTGTIIVVISPEFGVVEIALCPYRRHGQ